MIDPGYTAATEGAALFEQGGRGRFVVRGRAPAQMLDGILTGTLPGAPEPSGEGVLGGRATYHAVLTPKGKMISDLWCFLRGDEEHLGFLLDVPEAGGAGLAEHLRKFLPPRLASSTDVSRDTASISVVGPGAAGLLSRLALGLRVDPSELAELQEGEWRLAGSDVSDGLLVGRNRDVGPNGFDVIGPRGAVGALRQALETAGAVAATADVWNTLRVEAGRPAFGFDMDESTIPVEAGIHERAIDYAKGCYTGQEVIVRIRDRGHVNRTLRQLMLGDVPVPPPGADLFAVDTDPADATPKPVGVVTSAVRSPKFGQTVALGYVKRGVDGPLRV